MSSHDEHMLVFLQQRPVAAPSESQTQARWELLHEGRAHPDFQYTTLPSFVRPSGEGWVRNGPTIYGATKATWRRRMSPQLLDT
jgi:hypothetical protein